MGLQRTNKRWWTEKPGKRHGAIVQCESLIKTQMQAWLKKFSRYERLYAGVKTEVMVGTGRVLALTQGSAKKLPPVIYNGVKAVIDTKRAKITGTDIRPFAVTDGGTWKQKRRAKKMTKFVDGLFYETEMRTKGPEFYRHSRVVGTAAFKIFEQNARPTVEQVDVQELRVDAEDAMHGNPRMLIQVKSVHREVLREMFDGQDGRPKALQKEAFTAKAIEKKGESTIADRVWVYEAWHLPSGPGAGDGLRVICTETGTLLEEEWTEEDFGFVFLRGDNRLFGFWGVGDAEDLEGLQFQLDKINRTIQLCLHLCSVPRYAVQRGANVNDGSITNDVGVIVKFDGAIPPTAMETPPVPPELLEERNDILQKMFQLKGVSEAAAASQIPAGVDASSGEAQRVYADTQTERFNVEAKEYEQSFIRVAKKLIKCARRIHERDGKFAVKVPGKRFMESVAFGDIDLTDEEFDLQILPTSNMPKTLTGRIALAQELLRGGFIKNPMTEGRRLIDFPDLDDDTSLALAVVDYIESEIGAILDGGKMQPLDWPMLGPDGLQMCLDLGRNHWLRAKVEGAPAKALNTLANWLTQAGAQLKQLTPPPMAPPGGGAPGAGQPGMGAPPPLPVSQLQPAA